MGERENERDFDRSETKYTYVYNPKYRNYTLMFPCLYTGTWPHIHIHTHDDKNILNVNILIEY